MNQRIRQLRRALDLTQQAFAIRIGTVQNTITGYETGFRNPSNAVIKVICNEFGVNEEWLRYGKGDMFIKGETFNLDEFARQHGATAAEIDFLKVYFELDKNVRMALVNHFSSKFQIKTSLFDEVPDTASELEANNDVENEHNENVG